MYNERSPFVLEQGEDFDEESWEDLCSESRFHLAVRFGVPKAALWLMENKAETSFRDAKGLSRLDLARNSGDYEILGALKPML